MPTDGLRLGQVVISRRGRDAGRLYIVTKVLDKRFVEVADGQARTVSKPKKKNMIHLSEVCPEDPALAQRLQMGEPVSDREIREALARAAANRNEGGESPYG